MEGVSRFNLTIKIKFINKQLFAVVIPIGVNSVGNSIIDALVVNIPSAVLTVKITFLQLTFLVLIVKFMTLVLELHYV